MSLSSFNVRSRYFEPEQYILKGWLDVKSWESKSVSSRSPSGFGKNSFKKLKNRLHTWCDNDEHPDVSDLTPKVTLLIYESDVIDISVDKHGKSDNFIINVDNRQQLLLSAPTEGLKERWMFTFENMDDIRDDEVLASVNSPRKVFANSKNKSSAPKSFNRLPINRGLSSTDIESEEERRLAELAIACLEDTDTDDDVGEESAEQRSVRLSSEDPEKRDAVSRLNGLRSDEKQGNDDLQEEDTIEDKKNRELEDQVAAVTLTQPPPKYRSQLHK